MTHEEWQDWIRRARSKKDAERHQRMAEMSYRDRLFPRTFGEGLYSFITRRTTAYYFDRLERDPEFAELDKKTQELEKEVIRMVGGFDIAAKLWEFLRLVGLRDELMAEDAYLYGLLDGARFAKLFDDPAKAIRVLKKAASLKECHLADGMLEEKSGEDEEG